MAAIGLAMIFEFISILTYSIMKIIPPNSWPTIQVLIQYYFRWMRDIYTVYLNNACIIPSI